MELWKPIQNYSNYNVSTLGRIKNSKTGKILKQTISKRGYYALTIKPFGKHGKSKCFRVHREVAIAFIINSENKPTVNHKDGNKLNNVVTNLEWADQSEQMIHAYKNDLINFAKGSACKSSVLTDDQVNEIINNPHIRNADFARKFNVDRSAISKVRSGKNWKHKIRPLYFCNNELQIVL